jgi:hypothetical protein
VLWFERQVVSQLTETPDVARRQEVEAFVAGALHSMPEFLRAPIGAASLGLGVLAGVSGRGGRMVHSLESSPVPQFRQYVRLFRSLVLFAEQELPAT